jgi:hypothetical protein
MPRKKLDCTCQENHSSHSESLSEKPKKVKRNRQPTKYSLFVKENYNKVRDLPVKERFKKLAQMWKETKPPS